MSNIPRFAYKIVSILIILILTSGTFVASAQVNPEMNRNVFLRTQSQTVAANIAASSLNLLQDPGFDAWPYNTSPWSQNGTPSLCSAFDNPRCYAPGTGYVSPSGWAWLGSDINWYSQIYQYVTFPQCGASLYFDLYIGRNDPGSGTDDTFEVVIDGITLYHWDASQPNYFPTYTLIGIDVSQFADGNEHYIAFQSVTNDQFVYFNVDDAALIPNDCSISGNVGMANVNLNYTDGIFDNNITSLADGSYFFVSPYGWSGTVTPSRPCFTFTPASKIYSNVVSDQTVQNYTPAFDAASSCAEIDVRMGGTSQGTSVLPPNTGDRKSFSASNGPVVVKGTGKNSVPFIASERVAFLVGNTATSFSEMMGLPQNLVSNKYSFPAYDDKNFNSQFRFGNVSNTNVTVRISIGGIEMKTGCVPDQPISYPYSLAPGASLRVSCPQANGGPAVIQSTGGNIIAAVRVVPLIYNGSYSEIMGLPQSQLSNTNYFPWYNDLGYNASGGLDTQLRIANMSLSANTIRFYIGNHEKSSGCTTATVPPKTYPYFLLPNESVRVSCPGENGGPVRIVANGNIVTSERVAYFDSSSQTWIRFSELMGLPAGQLANIYYFPWYNDASLNTQLRFGNVGSSTATVHVYIGGQETTNGCTVNNVASSSPYTLVSGASLRVSCPGTNNGPVKIVSNQSIIASERVAINNGSAGINFSELMGLPQSQLTTSYVFPWYNNLGFNTQLRFGVP